MAKISFFTLTLFIMGFFLPPIHHGMGGGAHCTPPPLENVLTLDQLSQDRSHKKLKEVKKIKFCQIEAIFDIKFAKNEDVSKIWNFLDFAILY
jgi:hypothetical protein